VQFFPGGMIDEILLMDEIPNNHLGWLKPYKEWDIYQINWCLPDFFHQPYHIQRCYPIKDGSINTTTISKELLESRVFQGKWTQKKSLQNLFKDIQLPL